MKIYALQLRNIWSAGDTPLILSGFGVRNVIIGKNNVGKSKVLTALRWFGMNAGSFVNHSNQILVKPVDQHEANDNPQSRVTTNMVSFDLDEKERTELVDDVRKRYGSGEFAGEIDRQITRRFSFGIDGPLNHANNARPLFRFDGSPELNLNEVRRQLQNQRIVQQEVNTKWDDSVGQHIRVKMTGEITRRIRYVSGWRTLENTIDVGGQNLTITKHLHTWRAPEQESKTLRKKFQDVQQLFRRLMLESDLELETEHTGNILNVTSHGRYLPIVALGDGVAHLLMVAFHMVTMPDAILLIEEPETHLHPELQRNMLTILRENFKGTTFITTHSPVLLDSSYADALYRMEHDGHQSIATKCESYSDTAKILDLLDVRASDLLQANFVLWVEGPTDRMFINHCLKLVNPKLIEGIHYQIVCYGGSVRSYFALNEQDADLINILRLSRHTGMICDSDRASKEMPINETKERLRKECETAGACFWVTDCREIENYLPDAAITTAYQGLLGDTTLELQLPQFDDLNDVLAKRFPDPAHGNGWKVKYDENKARIIPLLLAEVKDVSALRYDFKLKMESLLTAIEAANCAA